MTTERPTIFSDPMVRAILADRKTQTRRVILPQPTAPLVLSSTNPVKWFDGTRFWKCPYGPPGTILWVRETWADLRSMGFDYDPRTGKPFRFAYRADTRPGSEGDEIRKQYGVKWRPSIHMPRLAARLFLRVTNVRVERLQDISEEDAFAEGVVTGKPYEKGDAVACFRALWDSINDKRGYGWDTNPYVWVIEFERIEVYSDSFPVARKTHTCCECG